MIPRWLRRLRARLRYRGFAADRREEIETHRKMAEADLAAQGLGRDDVQPRAARQLGNVTLARELARGVWIPTWLEGVWQDVRYAVRGLAKSPAFTITTIVMLTLTMGLTTNYFALVNGLLFKTWDVPDADRVVVVDATRWLSYQPGAGFGGLSLNAFRYLQDHARTVALVAYNNLNDEHVGDEAGRSVRAVSGSYFRVLGIPMTSGRSLTEGDDDMRQPRQVAVVSHEFWVSHLGGQSAVGQWLKIDGVSFAIVGVAGTGATDSRVDPLPTAWIPLSARTLIDTGDPMGASDSGVSFVAGRLRDAATPGEADAELRALNARLQPEPFAQGSTTTTFAVTGTALVSQLRSRSIRPPLVAFASAPLLVLLLGCANAANLQLARGLSRRRELAVRLALGASRARVVRQLLVDGLVLATVAGAASLVVAYSLPRVVMIWYESGLAQSGIDLTPDTTVFAFAAALALVTCVLSGLLPALRSTRMTAGAHYVGVERARLRAVMLAIQTAASVVLLLGISLLARGIQYGATAGLGFDADHVVPTRVVLPDGYDAARRRQFTSDLLDAAGASDLGPVAAGSPPLGGGYNVQVRPAGRDAIVGAMGGHFVSPDYFDVFRIRLLAGRPFGPRPNGAEAVVNETLATALWPGLDPIGRSFTYHEVGRAGANDKTRLVVGVVADAHMRVPDRIDPDFFEVAASVSTFTVRADGGSPARLAVLVRQLEPKARLESISIRSRLWPLLRGSIVATTAAAAIGLLALLIATVGTFGAFSYAVGERSREIGVRRALGARARDLVALLVARLCRPLGVGLAVGLLVAQPLGGLVRHYLFGLGVHDPLAYGTVIGLLALAAAAALAGPIVRAVRIDPAVTLRYE